MPTAEDEIHLRRSEAVPTMTSPHPCARISPDGFIDFSVQPPTTEFQAELAADEMTGYARAYSSGEGGRHRSVEALVGALERADAVAVIKAIDARNGDGTYISNEHVADVCRIGRGRLIGFAGVDPLDGETGIERLEHAVGVDSLRGLNLQLYHHGLRADDRRLWPLYGACVRLGIPVNLHVGMSFSARPMRYGDPLAVDQVACEFPDLTIICAPPGFPWIRELIAVAWRHAGVYIGLSGLRPRYLGRRGSGWEELLAYGRTVLREKMIFGTAYPLIPIDRSVQEIRELALGEDVERAWLRDNALRALGLEQ
jgi:predicted TIM-barrel fold metal-dependent hydrolase